MRKIQAIIILALLHWTLPCHAQTSGPGAALKSAPDEEEAVQFTDNNILFFYEAYADIPSSMESLAKCYSPEYRNAPTEFAKVDILKQITPVIERKIREAKDTKTVMLSIRCRIPEYDFTRKGFATPITADNFVTFDLWGGSYAVVYKGVSSP